MDIKLELANQVCAECGYRLFHGRCDDCGFPLLEKCVGNMWFVGCWFCHERREFALDARAAMHKARLAQVGIILETQKPELRTPPNPVGTSSGAFASEMPL